jgi:PKD repeat protein
MPSYQRLQPITINIDAPTAVALDNSGKIYVAEAVNNRLLVYSQSGDYQKTLLKLKRPISVAVDGNGRILIGNHYDNVNHKGNVEVYDADLNLLFKLGTGDGEFSQPIDIAVGGTGKIYVLDRRGAAVKIYNPDGSFYNSFGSSGNGEGEFHNPTSIAIDEARGEFIVLDHKLTYRIEEDYGVHDYGQYAEGGYWMDGARIQVFDSNLVFDRSFGEWGREEGQMNRPLGVAVDGEGKMYVTEAFLSHVKVFDGDGTYLGRITSSDKPMRTPLGITKGSSNRFYITALTSEKLEIYGIALYTQMGVAPLSLSFEGSRGGASPPLQSVDISNNGSQTLNWTASNNGNWIILSDTSGSTAASAVSTLSVGVDLNGLLAGTYTGSISLTAESGETEIVDVKLAVLDVPLFANAGSQYTGIEGQAVIFDGSNSSGVISLYEWDVDDNGTYEYSSTSPSQSHVYSQSGSYIINLKVTGDQGATDEEVIMASISDSSPTASFTGSPTTGTVPLTVNFTNSSTGYDQPLTYNWDLDGDGTTDSTEVNPLYTYDSEGSYTVKLTVTDSDGSTDTLVGTDYIASCLSPARVQDTIPAYYPGIQNAYNAAGNGNTIHSRAMSYTESLNFNRDISITLVGGYSCDYTETAGKTTVKGTVTVNKGTVTLENIIVE